MSDACVYLAVDFCVYLYRISSVTAIVIPFVNLSFADPYLSNQNVKTQLPALLLLTFLAGIAPIQILTNIADRGLSRIYKVWRRRTTAGNKPVVQLEGINSITSGRLSEEGIDYVQQIAFCRPDVIAVKTNFPLNMVNDWKEQAILHLLTTDVVIRNNNPLKNKKNLRMIFLVHLLVEETKTKVIRKNMKSIDASKNGA
jgi:hypothetical protein